MTKGLPGSGKSTWAREYQNQNPNTVRVNKDTLRDMLHVGVHSKGREEFVLKVRDFIVEESLKLGHDVIVDDTNLHSKHKNQMWKIAAKYNAEVETKDFTDVPIETCIERDLIRPNSVGSKVIRRMARQLAFQTVESPTFDPTLASVIICDLDGTIALGNGRDPYDASTCENDLPNQPIIDILKTYYAKNWVRPVYISGREDKDRIPTEKWLAKHSVMDDRISLFMRKTGDHRTDNIIKKEIYDAEIKGKYNVLFVLDDRQQVVDMWRALGLTCLQVDYGDF